MTSIFKHLCNSCGMSYEEAAIYLDIRTDTAESMWIGKHDTPDGIIIELKREFDNINEEAVRCLGIGLTKSDDEAIQRRMIEIMSVDLVLVYFRRSELT